MEVHKKATLEDAIMKMAWDTFAREGRKMFGFKKKVKDTGRTELITLNLKYLHLDYLYLMEDDTYEIYEFQTTNNNKEDLRRFRAYESTVSHQTGKEVFTYVIYSAGIKNPNTVLKTGFNTYQVQALTLANIDGDEKKQAIHDKLALGEPLTDEDALTVMFLPLTAGTGSIKDKILTSISLAKHFNKDIEINLEAMAYALAIKFLEKNELNTIKEELKMTVLGQMLRDDFIEEGIIQGRQEGLKKGTEEERARQNEAYKMLKNNIPLPEIKTALSLTDEELAIYQTSFNEIFN